MESELSIIGRRIAAICYERTDVQRVLFEYRNTRKDLQPWEDKLRELTAEREALIVRQRELFNTWHAAKKKRTFI